MSPDSLLTCLTEANAAHDRTLKHLDAGDTFRAIAALGVAVTCLSQALTLLAAALPPAHSLTHAPDAPDAHQDR